MATKPESSVAPPTASSTENVGMASGRLDEEAHGERVGVSESMIRGEEETRELQIQLQERMRKFEEQLEEIRLRFEKVEQKYQKVEREYQEMRREEHRTFEELERFQMAVCRAILDNDDRDLWKIRLTGCVEQVQARMAKEAGINPSTAKEWKALLDKAGEDTQARISAARVHLANASALSSLTGSDEAMLVLCQKKGLSFVDTNTPLS